MLLKYRYKSMCIIIYKYLFKMYKAYIDNYKRSRKNLFFDYLKECKVSN